MEYFKSWANFAEQAAKAGTVITIIEVIICLVTGKALNSMWILINALQFTVFISMWLIDMPDRIRIILAKLRKIVMGEFIEDLQIGKSIADRLGIESEDKKDLE